MAAIQHFYVENTGTPTTASSTYADIASMSVSSGNFTAGKKYLLLVNAQFQEDNTGLYKIRLAHGGTGFANTETTMSVSSTSLDELICFFEVWTAVGGEDITVQHAVTSGNGNLRYVTLTVINLSDDVVENTDWILNERSNDDALSTTPVDGASVTFTPASAGTWLILTTGKYTAGDSTNRCISRQERSGEATSSDPSSQETPGSTNWIFPITNMRAYSLTNASNTFKEVSAASASIHTRVHSQLFALNLSKFQTVQSAYTAGSTSLATPDYGNGLQSISITPSVGGDVLVLGFWAYDKNNASNLAKSRIQVDGTDAPSTEDFALRNGVGGSDEDVLPRVFLDSMTAASHTINLQGSVSATTSTPAALYRSLVAFSMELASAGSNVFIGKFGKLLQGKL